jgi:hypothetical protein
MTKAKTMLLDKTKIPPNVSLVHYMKQMMSQGTAPIYNAPESQLNAGGEIDNVYYFKLIYKIQLLHQVGAITPKEVARLITMLDSPDSENWTVAEECINQKFSEI